MFGDGTHAKGLREVKSAIKPGGREKKGENEQFGGEKRKMTMF